MRGLPQTLTSVSLQSNTMETKCLEDLTRLSNLRQLALDLSRQHHSIHEVLQSGVAGSLHRHVSCLGGLTSLHLDVQNLAEEHLTVLSCLPTLNVLWLQASGNVGTVGLGLIGKLTGLRDLELAGEAEGTVLDPLSQLVHLTRLALEDQTCRLQERELPFCSQLSRLKVLRVRHNMTLAAKDWAGIGCARQPVDLDLKSCGVLRKASLEAMKGLTRLTALNLTNAAFLVPDGLTALKGLSGLRELYLKSCNGLSNKPLTALQVHTQFAVLTLEQILDNNLSDSGLQVLEIISSSTYLNENHCPELTRLGVQRLCSNLRLADLRVRGYIVVHRSSAVILIWMPPPTPTGGSSPALLQDVGCFDLDIV